MKANFNKLQEIDNSKTPFKVPDNYFENFNEEIMNLLPEKEFKTPVKITMWDRVKPWVYMAAMFLGLFFTIKVLVTTTETKPTEKNTASATITEQSYWSDVEISEEEFFDYIETQFVDENYYDLVHNQDYLNSL